MTGRGSIGMKVAEKLSANRPCDICSGANSQVCKHNSNVGIAVLNVRAYIANQQHPSDHRPEREIRGPSISATGTPDASPYALERRCMPTDVSVHVNRDPLRVVVEFRKGTLSKRTADAVFHQERRGRAGSRVCRRCRRCSGNTGLNARCSGGPGFRPGPTISPIGGRRRLMGFRV